MHDLNLSLLETIRSLRVSVDPGSDRGQLFEARDRLRAVAEELALGETASLALVCSVVERLVSAVLRRGDVPGADVLEAAKDLVRCVEDHLATAAARDLAAERQAQATAAAPSRPPRDPAPQRAADPPQREPAVAPAPTAAFVQLCNDDVDESRLGEILVQAGSVSQADMNRVLGLQQVTRHRLGDILLMMGLVDERQLRDALERQRFLTLRMARGLQGHPGGLELRVGHSDLGNGGAGRSWPSAG